MPLVEVDGVTKRFDRFKAVHRVSMDIGRGESVGLMGPNGAGKTTLIRMIATLSRPTRGEVRIDGVKVIGGESKVRKSIGTVTHDTMLYPDLTARENLRFHAKIHGVDTDLCDKRLEDVGLSSRGSQRVKRLSHGMRKRLSLARATLHEPDLLLLDEPFSGLDPNALSALRQYIEEIVEDDMTVVAATHMLDEGYNLFDRFVILDRGRKIRDVHRSDFDGFEEFKHTYQKEVGGSQR